MIPKEIEKKNLEYFAEGKRAKIYVFKEGKKKFAVKVEKENKDIHGRIQNEVHFLKILNKEKIGPNLICFGNNYFVYKFVEGELILEYIEKTKNPYPMLIKILEQCRKLDKLGINKLEMHHPLKHIFIKKGKVVMIDFERAYYTKRPKNVTQFCQFILRGRALKVDNEKFILLIKKYKKDPSGENFEKIVSFLKV